MQGEGKDRGTAGELHRERSGNKGVDEDRKGNCLTHTHTHTAVSHSNIKGNTLLEYT